jgi:DNA repair photolyase
MIISASRRTDIPAFFGDWFINRLIEKVVLVRNPMNPNNVAKISLDPKTIECIVFWTKNPKNFLKYIPRIIDLGYSFYFQFTITTYDKAIEPNVSNKNEIIETFIELSNMIGKEKIIWRYDPIFINNNYSVEYHLKWFDYLCSKIGNYTEKCVISFIDEYNFLKKELKNNDIRVLLNDEMYSISKNMKEISDHYKLTLATCCETIDLSKFDILHNKCIDDVLINRITGKNIPYIKDKNQREECGCISSRDIGSYNSCMHNCKYCYAKRGNAKNEYDPLSQMLCDKLMGTEKIIPILSKSDGFPQIDLF